MSCLPCFGSKKTDSKGEEEEEQPLPVAQPRELPPSSPSPQIPPPSPESKNKHAPSPSREEGHSDNDDDDDGEGVDVTEDGANAKTFTFRELASATKNFRKECLLGESGFGKVYKGTLQSSGQVVAVKQLDKNGMQGNKDFLVEVLMLTLLHHPNLVDLIGYCADGDQRLLVYEYMPGGSLQTHLLDLTPDKKPLDWNTRMKIASGAALGLEYLQDKANPPIIYRDLKASNILLDEVFNPKLTDYGLAKLGLGNSALPSQRMITNGHSAPEYERNGELTVKSDIYSFGVILLELITGRKAMDSSRPPNEQNLVTWAQPYFRDPKRFPELADPLLNGKFPVRSLNQAVGVAAMCLQDEPSVRPLVGDLVAALSFLTNVPMDEPSASPPPPPSPAPPSEMETSTRDNGENHHQGDSSSTSSSEDEAPKERQKSKKDKNNNNNNNNTYHHSDSGSSSESLYHEDEEDEEESGDEGKREVKKSMKRGSKSRTRSRKAKEEGRSVSRKSSRGSSNNSFGSAQQQQHRGYSNLSRKSTEKSKYSTVGSISSRRSSYEEEESSSSDGEENGENSRQGSQARSVFSLDSRCYSNVDVHNDGGSNHGSKSEEEEEEEEDDD